MRIGVLSDTHGLLRAEAIAALQGVDHILHAGDVGDDAILPVLRAIAPLTAIRGNVDTSGLCANLPPTEAVELSGKLFYLLHSIHDLDLDPHAAQIDVIISGHSHAPGIETREGILYLNPGSAGKRRFRLPVSLAHIEITDARIETRLIELIPTP